MKATITNCLAEMVETKFGKDKWAEIVRQAGMQAQSAALRQSSMDVPDDQVGKLLKTTCVVLGVTPEQAYDAFGEYWCCQYAPKVYWAILRRFKNAREMLLGMDAVHVDMTATIPNAQPPRFDYTWENDRVLLVDYKSKRGMLDVYIGVARGVGKYFNERLEVRKVSSTRARIEFR